MATLMKKPTSIFLAILLVIAIDTAPAEATNISGSKLLAMLKVKAEQTKYTYSRDYFKHWSDLDSDGCDTRDEVLVQESVTQISCDLAGGAWISKYDGVKSSNPSSFDIDHFVPLKEAWDSGANKWDSDTREKFANDLDYAGSLIAVSASSNRSKSDRDPAQWLPTKAAFKCKYAATWVAVKYRWGLTIDAAEKQVLASILGNCSPKSSKISKPTKASIAKGTPIPDGSNTDGTNGAGLDPQFSSCAEAKRNGYINSYTRGINPEYKWYEDRDGDGVVCE